MWFQEFHKIKFKRVCVFSTNDQVSYEQRQWSYELINSERFLPAVPVSEDLG